MSQENSEDNRGKLLCDNILNNCIFVERKYKRMPMR